ncbi:hypothetical protein [Roseivirga seohaensis]|uniref:hypothetical protein n=1 Tax=Roseivirga seohaensis TaxID=1914963 RepID=UPI003BAB11F8
MIITVEIKKQLLRSYLKYVTTYTEGNTHLITRTTDFGKFVCSLVRDVPKPNRLPDTPETVHFKLPRANSLEVSRNKFAVILKSDQKKIEDFLEATFNLDYNQYYIEGIKLGFKQKEIIEAFIVSRKLSEIYSDNETLKKRQYRDDQKRLEKLKVSLLNKANYRNKAIESQFEPFLVRYSG